MGVCMILLMMPLVMASTAISCSGLSSPNRLEVFLQRDDGGYHVRGAQLREEPIHLDSDDVLRLLRLAPTVGHVADHDLLEVVDVVNEDSVELVDFGVHVARNSDVDEEH